MKLCLILVVICCWLRLGRACEYGSIRKVCKGEKSDRCSPVTRDDAHNDYVILFLFKIPENYEVYLYQLCESTETAANLTLSTVQRRGINCTTTGDQSTPDYLHFRADCGLMLEHEDYILYDFQSLGSTCNLPHQFVFINTTSKCWGTLLASANFQHYQYPATYISIASELYSFGIHASHLSSQYFNSRTPLRL